MSSTLRLRCLAVALGMLLACAAPGEEKPDFPLELDADAGEIVLLDWPAPDAPGSVDGAFRFLELRAEGRWAPSAFIGVRDDLRPGKFRVFITQAERAGNVVAGYDYVLDGRLVLRETVLKEIPRRAAVRLTLTWTETGRFSIAFFGEAPTTIETELRGMVLFTAASSAKAKFTLETGSFL